MGILAELRVVIAVTKSILHLARRVLDARAAAEKSFYDAAVRDPANREVYRRTYNAIVDIRERLTPEGIADAKNGKWPDATEKIL